jgi:long-chain acyl-CoA synthetase
MTNRIWLSSYPQGVPADIDAHQYASLVALMEESFRKYASRVAYSFMGKDISYAQTDSLSQAMAAYLQGLGLSKGDRVAIMMPNIPQYPVAVAGILRAGYCGGQRQPLVHPARTGTSTQRFGCQGDCHHRELCRHAGEVHCRDTR